MSHETIYQSLYVQGRGALRRELASAPADRAGSAQAAAEERERRGGIPGMVNISERPAEAADRAVPGHWEGDLIGAGPGIADRTPVERRPGSRCWCRYRKDMSARRGRAR